MRAMVMGATEDDLVGMFSSLWPHFSERDRRLVAAACARAMGRGGVTTVSRAAGLSRPTVIKAISELDEEPLSAGRVRKQGGGRRPVSEADPGLERALDALVDPDSRGDPESPLRWTVKSTRQLASALAAGGHPVAPNTVRSLLYRLGYSLQSNAKALEGAQHPDRNAQFGYINEQVRRHLRRGEPVVSVDTKKKELIGNYKNSGTEWRQGQRRVNTYDFVDKQAGKAIPYGVYDIKLNRGFVSVGTDADTAAFAVATLRSWWQVEGATAYPRARRLLVCADAGGSNGYRLRLWKRELARLADDEGISITVSHFPPGTSKWNKIEHRLFSAISTNWKGQPLTSHEVVVNLIGATTNRGGLTVKAQLDKSPYPTKVKIAKKDVDALPIEAHQFHGEWNYTVRPVSNKRVVL
jgi:Rhodopirellula transposase DDE domain